MYKKNKIVFNSKKSYTFTSKKVQHSANNTIKSPVDNNSFNVFMKQLRNIFITLFTLLSFNGVGVQNISLNVQNKDQISELSQKFHSFSIDSFVEDTTPNEDFDLEEDNDDTDDDFLETMFSKNSLTIGNLLQNYFSNYSFSHQSVKKFILYCSLKLHC